MIINIFRWIISTPVAVAVLYILFVVLQWLLGLILKVGSFIMFAGTRFYTPDMSSLESFIFVTCLSSLISAGVAGYIGGKICPQGHLKAKLILFGVIILPILILSSAIFWDSEHWFYSILWILDMIIASFIFISCAATANEENE